MRETKGVITFVLIFIFLCFATPLAVISGAGLAIRLISDNGIVTITGANGD